MLTPTTPRAAIRSRSAWPAMPPSRTRPIPRRTHRGVLMGLGGPMGDRATLVSTCERPVLSPDFAGAGAQAGDDPTLDGRALQDALRRAIATCRGSCSWHVDVVS